MKGRRRVNEQEGAPRLRAKILDLLRAQPIRIFQVRDLVRSIPGTSAQSVWQALRVLQDEGHVFQVSTYSWALKW